MAIKVFNTEEGGWVEVEVDTLEDVQDILDRDEHTRLPYSFEINRHNRQGRYTWNELAVLLTDIPQFRQ